MRTTTGPSGSDPVRPFLGRRVAVVVWGDLGRSPRMNGHALALAKAGAEVHLVGLAENRPVSDGLTIHGLAGSVVRKSVPRSAYLPGAAWDSGMDAWTLRRAIAAIRPDLLLVQTPPFFPALPVALGSAAKVVLDWHNLTSSMLALRLGPSHPVVGLVERAEFAFGRRASAHVTVSRSMARHLEPRLGREVLVFKDAPMSRIVRGPSRSEARRRLEVLLGRPLGDEVRIGLSPTSFGPDEDFEPLYDALSRGELSELLLLISGRGPGRDAAIARFSRFSNVVFVWVEAGDYPALIASADFGLCFHHSASGLDLPMKVQDLWGAGLFTLVRAYPAVEELLADAERAAAFRDGSSLRAALLDELQRPRPRFRPPPTFEEGWFEVVMPKLLNL